ncbi:MAG: pyridoxal-phosphate dependent enzyme [Chloroflexi bacterium]|nr:MAG: pyridoxal-phosphate dependent enzyme [Chloroflexota bacterium]
MLYEHITELIGNTPLLKIDRAMHGLQHIELYAKLEYYNPFGSLKDRVAYSMLKEVLDEGKSGHKTIVESSSGNTAKAMSALCAVYGLPFKTVTSRIRYPEVRMILHILGAQLEELPSVSECPDPFDPNDFLAVAKNLVQAEPEKYHLTDQYFNPKNPETHYQGTGKELLDDLGKVDYFISFLGTCGSSLGVGSYLKERNSETKIFGIVSSPGNVIPGGRMSNELWEVGFFERAFYDDIVEGNIQQALHGMLELNRKCGILCGPTTGLNYYAGLQRLRQEDDILGQAGKTANAVFIACDRLEPYTSFVKKYRPDLVTHTTSMKPTVASQAAESIAQVRHIPPSELHALLQNTPPLLIDIRGNFTYSIGHIPSSINMLDEILAQLIEQGPVFPKKTPIVLVCSVGTIARKYAAFLQKQGYQAMALAGGIAQWKHEGYPLVRTADE